MLTSIAVLTYIAGLLFMVFIMFVSAGFPGSGPRFLETVWYTVFWPLSVGLAYLAWRVRN